MSKLNKLLKSPRLFFEDRRKKAALKILESLSQSEINRFSLLGRKVIPKSKEIKGQQEYLQHLLNFTDSYPVNLLSDKRTSFWPYLRNELKVQLNLAWKKNIIVQQNFDPYTTQLCREKNLPLYWREALREQGAVEIEELDYKNVDFLFFTNLNSVDHVQVDGFIHNRILDPILEKALKEGYRCEKIEIIKAVGAGLKKLPYYKIGPIKILPPFEFKVGRYQNLIVPKDFVKVWNHKVSIVPLVDENKLLEFYDWQMHMREMYLNLLKKFMPKAIFFHPYYYQTALIDAASSLGIKTVDVQHGLQVGYNKVFYANWNEMPVEGYSQLPEYFWVWGEKERENIQRNFKSKILKGGYPWLDRQLDFDDGCFQKLSTKIPDSKKLALVTLQHDGFISEKILDYIKQTSNEVFWLLRKHPKGMSVKADFATMVNVISGSLVDTCNLASILKKVDVHFSSGSSVVVEADYYGVYSYVYSKEGYLNFADEIDRGLVGHVGNAPVDFNSLPYTNRNESHPTLNAFYKCDYKELFAELLEL